MSLAKTITKQFIKMAKDSDRVQNSVDQMKGKLISESLTVVKSAGIDPSQLPFDPVALLAGNIPNPQTLLTPENVCSVPPLTNSQKNKANIAIQKSQIQLGNIIENSNKLKSALIAIQTPITGIRVTGESTLSFANALSNIIKIIKAIPIPTAFGAPAVALPVKVLTILSSTLIKLDKKVDIAKGTISLIAPMIKQISGILNAVITTVNNLETAIQSALVLTSFVKSVVDLGDSCDVNSDLYIVNGDVLNGDTFTLDRVDGLNMGMIISTVTNGNANDNTSIININPSNLTVTFSSANTLISGTGIIFKSYEGSGVSQADVDRVTDNTNEKLQNALDSSGDSSLLFDNQQTEANLIASFPFEYKGFLLTLVNNPNNATFSQDTDPESETFGQTLRGPDFPFSSRKIRATRDFTDSTGTKNTIFTRTKFNTPLGDVTLFNDPGGQGRYSFSTSVSILVQEMKYKIDNYLQGVNELALPAIAEASTGRVGRTPSGGNRPNQQVYTPPSPIVTGSDDPPSPPSDTSPLVPPAFYFNGRNSFQEVTPSRPMVSGTFTVIRPIKIKMITFGGSNGLSDTRALLRIFKNSGLIINYNFMMEEQFAESMETITTQDNPQGYYSGNSYNNIIAPEYWPINPGYANGQVANNLGIFRYELEFLNSSYGLQGSTNFAKFEIEAQ